MSPACRQTVASRSATAAPPTHRLMVIAHDGEMGGGADRVLHDVVAGLENSGRWAPTVVFPGRGSAVAAAEHRGWPTHVVMSRRWAGPPATRARRLKHLLRNLLATLAIVKLIREVQPHVMLVNTLAASPSGAIAARLSRVPVAWWAHEQGTADHGLTFHIGRERSLRVIARLSTTVLSITATVRDSLAPHIDPHSVVATGVALRAAPVGATANPSVSAPLRLAVIGTTTVGKRQATVVEALAILVHELGRPATLTCVGWSGNDEAARIRTLAEDLGVADLIVWTGQVDDIESVYRDADVIVSAAVDEGLSMVVAEAMQRCRPVVVAASGGQQELVEHGSTGLTFTPGDAADLAGQIDRLAGDDDLRLELVAAAAASMHRGHNVTSTTEVMGGALDALRRR